MPAGAPPINVRPALLEDMEQVGRLFYDYFPDFGAAFELTPEAVTRALAARAELEPEFLPTTTVAAGSDGAVVGVMRIVRNPLRGLLRQWRLWRAYRTVMSWSQFWQGIWRWRQQGRGRELKPYHLYIEVFFTRPSYRRYGVERRLIAFAKRETRLYALRDLYVHLPLEQDHTINIFEGCGFEPLGVIPPPQWTRGRLQYSGLRTMICLVTPE